jgi:capsule polysaccharide export protein KpsC/LpsZ
VLAHPSVDLRWLAEGASVVVTVTGTIGLESYLMGKPCVLFGHTFFSHLCYRAPSLGELRSFLEGLLVNHVPATVTQKEIEIAKLLHVGGNFLISDPWSNPTVMAAENIRAARDYLKRHVVRLEESIEIKQ